MLVIFLRILFAFASCVVFMFIGLLFGTMVQGRASDRDKTKALAYAFNTLLLAIFFTLWWVAKGAI